MRCVPDVISLNAFKGYNVKEAWGQAFSHWMPLCESCYTGGYARTHQNTESTKRLAGLKEKGTLHCWISLIQQCKVPFSFNPAKHLVYFGVLLCSHQYVYECV